MPVPDTRPACSRKNAASTIKVPSMPIQSYHCRFMPFSVDVVARRPDALVGAAYSRELFVALSQQKLAAISRSYEAKARGYKPLLREALFLARAHASRCRTASNNVTPVATETLRLSVSPG